MIKERAQVIEEKDGWIQVDVQRQSACGGCSAKSGCGTNLIAALFGRKPVRLSLQNDIEARPGDTVVLGIEDNLMVSGSILLYLMPLLGLLGGAMAGRHLLGTELMSIIGGLFGMTLVLWLVNRLQKVPDVKLLGRERPFAVNQIDAIQSQVSNEVNE